MRGFRKAALYVIPQDWDETPCLEYPNQCLFLELLQRQRLCKVAHRRRGEKKRLVDGYTLQTQVFSEDVQHLRAIGQYEEFLHTHGYHWKQGLDIDTFFSIAISILAVQNGMERIENEVQEATEMFGDDLHKMAERLLTKKTALTRTSCVTYNRQVESVAPSVV